MEHLDSEVIIISILLLESNNAYLYLGEKGDTGPAGPSGPSGLPGPDVRIALSDSDQN